MLFQMTGTIILKVSKEFEAETWKQAQNEVELLENWGINNLLDFVRIDENINKFDTLSKIRKQENKK